jgi:transcriptional regulator with XRE-family HTH domain
MTRAEYLECQQLAEKLIAALEMWPQLKLDTKGRPAELQRAAKRLRSLLVPPPTLSEIISRVPGDNHTEKARAIGISRQGYYNLLGGVARPNVMTARRLAELTGVPFDVVTEVW